ncbi:c-type cytochrome [Paracoccus niistensis]|uniref:C-type cytochrome n=1 Tax=Paracoccus niistensis TaxID=632935 RepID=A0ABV6HZU2_9RHOB
MIGRTSTTVCAVVAATTLLGACTPERGHDRGREYFVTYCADCHGATGKGDGPAAPSLTPAPTDLTMIARRNGQIFPKLQVMGKINGHTMGSSDRDMPQFADVLNGPPMMYDAGDGRKVETSMKLVELVEYLETLQVE